MTDTPIARPKRKSGKPTRHDARHQALHALYAADVRDVSPLTLLDNGALPLNDKVLPYARQIVSLVLTNLDIIDDYLVDHLHKWDLYRLATVDRNILRIATAELLYIPDAPVPVAITEAVKLATELASEDSPKFINGVLGSVGKAIAEDKAAQAEYEAEERARIEEYRAEQARLDAEYEAHYQAQREAYEASQRDPDDAAVPSATTPDSIPEP